MHAVVIDDGELRWQERPDPEPGDHDIVVRVRAAGVNGADLMQRAGRYPAPPGWPQEVPGLEMAGEVAAAGARVTRFRAGDRVMALVGGGAQAELAVVDEAHALAAPAGVSWAEAGGFMEAHATAYDALFRQAGVTLGDRVLVSGAAGGVGTAAVQLAAAAGATVTASVRDAAQHDAVAALGAARVVLPDDVEAAGPYDVVLELVGAASLPAALASLALNARVVVIGVGSGSRVEVDLLQLMGRRARLSASTLRARPAGEKAVLVATLGEQVVPALAAGRLKVPVVATFPLAEATAAYERFAAAGKVGKVVLTA
ncbi:MAG TPA: zinc-binding dehydrogenase [Thermoleophilia bacterium]|nr:zinc-binding dehydrogenase [Thermoleophilia bacterium]